MDVMVDGKPTPAAPEDLDALETLVAISEGLRAEGRAMVSVRVNGETIAPERLAETLREAETNDVRRIEIETENVAQLAVKVLREFEEVLPELPQACHQLAQIFQGNAPQEGFDSLKTLLDIWTHIKERQQLVARSLDIELTEIQVNGTSFERLHMDLNQFLTEAANALEAGDHVLLGDLLEYELAPRAETETAIVTALRQAIETQRFT